MVAVGTMVTEFLATLNRPPCFANHCDWRIPNVRELQSIADYENYAPAVNAVFHNAAGCGRCTDVRLASCSCAAFSNFYWSSTTDPGTPYTAWSVFFGSGVVDASKVRATATWFGQCEAACDSERGDSAM